MELLIFFEDVLQNKHQTQTYALVMESNIILSKIFDEVD